MSHVPVRSGILEHFQRHLKVVFKEMCPSEIINTFFHNRNCKNFNKTKRKEISRGNLECFLDDLNIGLDISKL